MLLHRHFTEQTVPVKATKVTIKRIWGEKPCSLQPGDVLMFAPPRPLQELRAIEHFLGHGILTGCPVALAVGMD